jgi:uncharacterized protein (TIGR00255 family)
MTGHGQAKTDGPWGALQVEVRTVNHRGLKVVVRLGDAFGRHESEVEGLVRQAVQRGTVQLNARWQRSGAAAAQRVNTETLGRYYQQLHEASAAWPDAGPIDVSRLLLLPGVLEDPSGVEEPDEAVLAALSATVQAALENLNAMRDLEGEAMGRSLREDLAEIRRRSDAIAELAPAVVEQYRQRLRGKIEAYLREHALEVSVPEVLREVQLFADRSDISEELTRLASHLDRFEEALEGSEAHGRKLDFVVQEMFRETNTIGSKASDADISSHVVEVKCALERIRELVQNIE